MNHIFYIFWIIFAFFGTAINDAPAQEFFQRSEIPSSPNPVGSGARALGMGGAFIAIADDATAASWNPGGLIQLELPEISLVSDAFHRTDDNSFGTHPEADGRQTVSEIGINYFSAAYPFNFRGYNMIISLNYQKLYDFTREWKFPMRSDSESMSSIRNSDYRQEGNLSAVGLAYGIQVTPAFSLGFTLNLWDNRLSKNEWKQDISEHRSGIVSGNAFVSESQSSHKYSFRGFNANMGILWNITERLSLGAVLKTPFKADLRHEHSFSHAVEYPEFPDYGSISANTFESDESLDMPMSYGMGLAYKISKKITVSVDAYRTEWDDFVQTDAKGKEISPITGLSVGESDISPTYQVRMGAEYLWITEKFIIPLCAGVFYDPAPAQGSPDDFFGFSIGSGIGWKQFHFDFSYQYRFAHNVGSSALKEWDFSEDTAEHTVYSSLVIHF
jgi:long-subunit fatty acid transport protein